MAKSPGCAARRPTLKSPDRLLTLFSALVMVVVAGAVTAQPDAPELTHTMTPLDEPFPAPAFALEDMDGKGYTLDNFENKVVLINFWATWCPPCRREMPSMERLYQALGDEDFVVLAVNQWETPDHVFAYMGQLDVYPSFPILFDPQGRISLDYGVDGLPTSFLIDRQGRVVRRAIGGREFDHPDIQALIREYLE
jgi:thiol-disulfide isomerase/thioredoxin